MATRAGKMELSCLLEISRLVPQDQKSFFGVLSHIINPLLTKLVRSRWLNIGQVFFLHVYGPRLHKHAKKELGQYPAILTKQAWSITHIYYMTSSVSGQDEPNRALWLATRAGKMERYCPLGISRLVPQDQRSFFGVLSHIINPLLTKIVRSRWLDIGLVLFFACLWTSTSSRSINTQKKNLANIQSSWPHAWSITHTYIIRELKARAFLRRGRQPEENISRARTVVSPRFLY